MDEHISATEPFLLGHGSKKKRKTTSLFVSSVKWVLKILMLVIFVSWVAIIFLYPTEFGSEIVEQWFALTKGTVFGLAGSTTLLLTGPIIAIAILAIIHVNISGEKQFQEVNSLKYPKVRLLTFPVLVDGPFGVVSAAEFIGIVLFVVYVGWAVYAYTIQNLDLMSSWQFPAGEESIILLELTGLRLGMIGLFCLSFLFLPIARGSFLLRVTDIPFEHAAKYHVWLGHLTMLLFTLHGLFFVIGWTMQGELLNEILEWRDIGIANLAGVISLLAGLFMWVTSLRPVRKWNFELFFYTHQLYIVFILFLAMHVGDFIFGIAAGGIFLFMLDRFLRFWQSRKTVDVISSRSFPCGTVELVLSKPANLRYNALSFIFLQVRELSWLQWHPFSVSSSPLDGKYHLSVLIKVLGRWTDKLRGDVMNMVEAEQQNNTQLKITTSVEGPYGHEVPYHHMYENLVLVAGGIGISPFLAILSDILHRVNEGSPCLPRNVLLVWAIKRSDELPLLSTVDMESICHDFSSKINLEVRIYVTRQSEPPLEDGNINDAVYSTVCPMSNGSGSAMSILVGTGNNLWSGLYVILSTVGFIILFALLNIFYINPYEVSSWWYKGLLYMACMAASVVIFGGLVIGLWHLWGAKRSAMEQCDEAEKKSNEVQPDEGEANNGLYRKTYATSSSTTIQYGSRPDFKDIFEHISKSLGKVDVGVIICGPETLQSSVAREIRYQNLARKSLQAVFHFHSHSFDL